MKFVAWLVVVLSGCATPYAYRFHLTNPGARSETQPAPREVIEDTDVKAAILVDPTTASAVFLDLTNKTEQVAQVKWEQITMTSSNGNATTPRPDVDLGWIAPAATISARLVPFVLPRSGDAAKAYQGIRFELTVPMVVRRQLRTYRYTFSVDVQQVEEKKP